MSRPIHTTSCRCHRMSDLRQQALNETTWTPSLAPWARSSPHSARSGTAMFPLHCVASWSLTPATMRCVSCRLRECKLQPTPCQPRSLQRYQSPPQNRRRSQPLLRCPRLISHQNMQFIHNIHADDLAVIACHPHLFTKSQSDKRHLADKLCC
ncbi:Hypothetical protein, putative [Bodo saltans]|uniref:Uncharacterized protein n=1 Tax=Bodo saltans TaxID=75058 RepID=A0A0S4IUD2_BODSA|nr:Hypothetical protein, putative [Bodo saltans]|eukprot:CUE88887.1 Hypothetical protein, putative [Bodo saltans]